FSKSADDLVLNATQQNLSMEMVASLEMETSRLRAFMLNRQEEDLTSDQYAQEQFEEIEPKFELLLETERGKALFAEIHQTYSEYHTIMERCIGLRREGKAKAALALANDIHTLQFHS